MAQIHIFVGSVMGTAEHVATAVTKTLSDLGHSARASSNFDPNALADQNSVALICTSNTGMGDLPANIAPMLSHLENSKPELAGKRYGVINLGDSSYPNFAQAGKTLDEALSDLGATRIGPPLTLDAILVDNHAQQAQAWATQWAKQL